MNLSPIGIQIQSVYLDDFSYLIITVITESKIDRITGRVRLLYGRESNIV